MRKNIHFIVGARPNFIKLAPLFDIFNKSNKFKLKIINTGQHFHKNMSYSFLKNFKLENNIINFNSSKNNQIETISSIMSLYNKFIENHKPHHVIVFGDVNSTIACSFVASRNNIKISHIEAGLRSFDQNMPEEINRILTDHLSHYFFVHSKEAIKNLIKENLNKKNIFNVGNIIINTYFLFKKEILSSKILKKLNIENNNYILITLHRPNNVDNLKELNIIKKQLYKLAKNNKIILIKHPRVSAKYKNFYSNNLMKTIKCIDPLDYFDFTKLLINSKLIITDSGGVQEEAVFHNIKCAIIRKNTERNVALKENSNILIKNKQDIFNKCKSLLKLKKNRKIKIPYWDDKVAKRIYNILEEKI